MPSHAQAPAPSAASPASSSASSSPQSTMSDVPPEAASVSASTVTQPMTRRQSSTRSVDTVATYDSGATPPPSYSEEEMKQAMRRQVRTSTYGPDFLKELEKHGLTGLAGDGIGKVTVVTGDSEASAIYHSVVNNKPIKDLSTQNILFAVPNLHNATGKVVDLVYAQLSKKEKKPTHRLKGEKRRKGFLDAEFSAKAPSADFMDKVNARLEQENIMRMTQGRTPLAPPPPELQPSLSRRATAEQREKDLPPVPPQETAGPLTEEPASVHPSRPPLPKHTSSSDSVLSLASLTQRTPLKLVNPDPLSPDSSRRTSMVPPVLASSPAAVPEAEEEANEDVLIVYLNQESPRGRRKHKSKSTSPSGSKHHKERERAKEEKAKERKEKPVKEAEPVIVKPPKTHRKTSDDKVKRSKSTHTHTSDVKRSKSVAASERTTHTQITVTDVGADLHRRGTHSTHRSKREREKETWHGNTAGKAPTGLDRKPVLDQVPTLAPSQPTRTASHHSSHRSRNSVRRTHSLEENYETMPVQVLMHALGYTPPPPPPPSIQQTPYSLVQSPGMYNNPSTPFTPYVGHGTPGHYASTMTPFSAYGTPMPTTPFLSMPAPSVAPTSPWAGASLVNLNTAPPVSAYSPYPQPQQSVYGSATPHSMMSSASLPHGSTAASAGIYAGGATPMMNGYPVFSPFGGSTPMLLPPGNNSNYGGGSPGGGHHLYTSPYATNPTVLYSS